MMIDQLNSELDSLLEELQSISTEDLNRKPEVEAWSVAEVMQHLMTSERLSLQYVKKKTTYAKQFTTAGLSMKLRMFGLKLFLWTPLKFKAPAAVDESAFQKNLSLGELQSIWKNQRNEMAVFLKDAPDEWKGKEIYRHPLAGRLTLAGMLEFFLIHFRRHRQQIYRTLEKVGHKSS